MVSFINQFSFLIFGGSGLAIIAFVMWRSGWPGRVVPRVAVLTVYIGVMLLILLRTEAPAGNVTVRSYADIEALISNQQPTFIMLYSQFCVNCIAQLPSVRDIQTQLIAESQAIDLIFLDIHTRLGSEAKDALGFVYSPTYILYDSGGKEVIRTNNLPQLAEIRAAISG